MNCPLVLQSETSVRAVSGRPWVRRCRAHPEQRHRPSRHVDDTSRSLVAGFLPPRASRGLGTASSRPSSPPASPGLPTNSPDGHLLHGRPTPPSCQPRAGSHHGSAAPRGPGTVLSGHRTHARAPSSLLQGPPACPRPPHPTNTRVHAAPHPPRQAWPGRWQRLHTALPRR